MYMYVYRSCLALCKLGTYKVTVYNLALQYIVTFITVVDEGKDGNARLHNKILM